MPTHWRDEPIVPEDYEDIDALIRLARRARDAIVDFDWAFKRDQPTRLRRAVYEWSIPLRGRYRRFDARVLAAINLALGDTDSVLVLSEPGDGESVDCDVSCVANDDGYRLQGHATFDIIFSYGCAGVDNDPELRARLGPTIRETLVKEVSMLGWDLHRLQDKRYLPVINALYGLPLDYGNHEVEPAGRPPTDIPIDFNGPFSLFNDDGRDCLFTQEIAKSSGVYLWTVEVSGEHRVWYVGQTTRGFGTRMAEHVANALSGKDTTWDAAALARGEHRYAESAVVGEWPATLCSFLRDYESRVPDIIRLIRLPNIHLAPLANEDNLYNRVEGAIGRYYKSHPDPELRDFLLPGLRLPAPTPGEKPIRLVLSSDVPIAGLPPTLLA